MILMFGPSISMLGKLTFTIESLVKVINSKDHKRECSIIYGRIQVLRVKADPRISLLNTYYMRENVQYVQICLIRLLSNTNLLFIMSSK